MTSPPYRLLIKFNTFAKSGPKTKPPMPESIGVRITAWMTSGKSCKACLDPIANGQSTAAVETIPQKVKSYGEQQDSDAESICLMRMVQLASGGKMIWG
jgi:Fe-S-cluster-containing dehydrogenase component